MEKARNILLKLVEENPYVLKKNSVVIATLIMSDVLYWDSH